MTVFEQVKSSTVEAGEKKKCVLVGIRFDGRSRELLNWALVKVADPGDHVLALHVCSRGSEHDLEGKTALANYLKVYEVLCNVKKVRLSGQILCGSSIRRALVREAKKVAAAALLVGIDKQNALRTQTATAKYCAKRLPLSTDVLAIHNGKIIFRRFGHNQLPGAFQDPRPSIYSNCSKECQSEFAESETETELPISDVNFSYRDDPMPRKSIVHGSSRILSVSHIDARPGWPLLRTSQQAPATAAAGRRNESVVQWVMSLPDRSQHILTIPRTISRDSLTENIHTKNSGQDELSKEINLLSNRETSNFALFDFEVLCKSTSRFSSENLIGKGGSNLVYKGTLSDGKKVAVKVLNSTEESRRDFALEVDLLSSLKHRFIAPLHGVCIRNDNLYSVYDFFQKGSLEQNLHGHGKGQRILPWTARYKIALGVAEALNYLHNKISRPVIHRDVKSSNILLTDDLEPKLSDFGLAMWEPKASHFLQVDLVGTFGYLAPEYFMSGKVSDRIDVYSFGVVLLELLSGRKPISPEASKGQESLIMWAKPIIKRGDIKGILDPRLAGDINETELKRMVLAATLCLKQASRLRPGIDQILRLLRGDCNTDSMTINMTTLESLESKEENQDDEVYPESCALSHLGLALLDTSDDFTSFNSSEQSTSLSVEEYMKGRWSGYSSLE